MKNYLIVFILGLSLISCSKIEKILPKSNCKIKKIVSYPNLPGFYDSIVGTMSYTSWGAPLSIIMDNEQTGIESYFWQYDKKRNLTAFIQGYTTSVESPDTSCNTYIKYIYKNGTIIGDSTWLMTNIKERNDFYNLYFVSKYVYDVYGRIIKVYTKDSESNQYSNVPQEFHYKSNENPYINNYSLAGTHPVLMFSLKDYNIRNKNVLQTNQYGLPIEFGREGYLDDGTYVDGYKFPFGNAYPIHRVEYECGIQHK